VILGVDKIDPVWRSVLDRAHQWEAVHWRGEGLRA
jgi:hypothetical protein